MRYCLSDIRQQKTLLREFVRVGQYDSWRDRAKIVILEPRRAQKGVSTAARKRLEKLFLDERLERALRWVKKYGSPFPLREHHNQQVDWEACDLDEIITVSKSLGALLAVLEALRQRQTEKLKKLLQMTPIKDEEESTLSLIVNDVRINNNDQLTKRRNSLLRACWKSYDDHRWSRTFIDTNGITRRLRKDRIQPAILYEPKDGRVDRYNFEVFARTTLADRKRILEEKHKAEMNGQDFCLRLSGEQEKFCSYFDQLKEEYESLVLWSIKNIETAYIPISGHYNSSELEISLTRTGTGVYDLCDIAHRLLTRAANIMLTEMHQELICVDNQLSLRFDVQYPWQAIVLAFVRMLQHGSSRLCPSCLKDMSFKRADAKTCSESCSKKLRRKKAITP